jgi:hypothetical protein
VCNATVWYRWKAAANYAAWFATNRPKHRCPNGGCPPSETRPLIQKKAYSAAPAGFIGRIRVSLQSVVNTVPLCPQLITQICEGNLGQHEYVVASLLILVGSLVQHHTRIACALAAQPLDQWVTNGTVDLETVARNTTHLESNLPSQQPNLKHPLVARIKTILGRDLHQHDLAAELHARTTPSKPHAYNMNSFSPCDCWHTDLYLHLKMFANEAIASAPDKPQSARAWWQSRAVWLSNGTSSQKPAQVGPRLDKFVTDPRVRRTKRLLCSHLGRGWFDHILKSRPKMVCRAATKNEPGLKKRALRASDDQSYFVAGFASNNLEKYLSHHGAFMRQTPDDVRSTSQRIQQLSSHQNRIMLCLDYSDFNNTHTTRSRVYANLAIARAYLNQGQVEQAQASLWMARAQLNHYLDGHLSSQGLSSGERDTARDNTMLHHAYSTLAIRACATRNQTTVPHILVHMCGDDEVMLGTTQLAAALYIAEHETQGHTMSIRKMLCSDQTAEFLQYNMFTDTGRMPVQPLAPAINNYVSGSWYKTANYDPTDYPQQASDAAASCIRRGAPHEMMCRLTINTVHWLSNGQDWKSLLKATNLFGAQCIKPTTEVNTSFSSTDALKATNPSAVDEYTSLIAARFQLQPSDAQCVKDYAAEQVYSSFAADIRSTTKQTLQQTSESTLIHIPQQGTIGPKTIQKWVASNTPTRGEDMVWLAVQLGIPTQLISRVGYHTLVHTASNLMRAHINRPVPYPKALVTPTQYAMLPGAIAPYFCVATSHTT